MAEFGSESIANGGAHAYPQPMDDDAIDGFSARLAYTFRSAFFVGLDRSTPEYQDDTGTLAASLGYTVNNNLTLTFDALNLNNPTLKYYGANTDQPRAFYKNGRQFYAGVRIKF